MSGQIRLTPAEMHSRANEYRREADNIQQVIASMDRLLNQLQSEWEGASSRSFDAQFQQLRPSFVNGKELVETIAQQLDQTAQALADLDQEIAGKFGAR